MIKNKKSSKLHPVVTTNLLRTSSTRKDTLKIRPIKVLAVKYGFYIKFLFLLYLIILAQMPYHLW